MKGICQKSRLNQFILCFLFSFLPLSSGYARQTLEKFFERPQLVVLIVIDQFRADYLTRFYQDFLPLQTSKQLGGFRYLMAKGAYYPFAQYELFQAMTCPGHSMIMTGVYPAESGIPLNDWFDRSSQKMVNCVEDDQFKISPHFLRSTTVGDEFKNLDTDSRVVSLALKDRSAVMMGGHRPDHAFWFNEKARQWETSAYYGAAPQWLDTVNKELGKRFQQKNYFWKALKKEIPYADNLVFSSPLGLEITTELALESLKQLKLGQRAGKTDFLLLSYSAHDFVGHLYGPNSAEAKDMTLSEDQEISKILNLLQKQVGLKKTMIVLTADHGVAPSVEFLKGRGFEAGRIDYLDLFKGLSAFLNKKYGDSGKDPWIQAFRSLNFYVNEKVLEKKQIEKNEFLRVVREWLKNYPGIKDVFLGGEKIPAADGVWATAWTRQLVAQRSGDLVILPEPFFYEKSKVPVTHMTPYNYDNQVPLLLFGGAFKEGVYSEVARITDIAPTLSYVLKVIPPPKAHGRILQESLR